MSLKRFSVCALVALVGFGGYAYGSSRGMSVHRQIELPGFIGGYEKWRVKLTAVCDAANGVMVYTLEKNTWDSGVAVTAVPNGCNE